MKAVEAWKNLGKKNFGDTAVVGALPLGVHPGDIFFHVHGSRKFSDTSNMHETFS
jgi:hypothetical protein